MAKVTSVATPSSGLQANTTPAAVATPLPPLKAKNTGQTWPTKAARPVAATVRSPQPKRSASTSATTTGT